MKTQKIAKVSGNGSKRDYYRTGAYVFLTFAAYQAAIVQSWFCGGAA